MHHVIPKALGGNKEDNLVPLCEACHGLVHNKDFTDWKELQRAGITKAKAEGRYVGRSPKISRIKVSYLNQIGMSTYKIAAIMGISRMSVHRILNEEGWSKYRVKVKEGVDLG
jgi:DNA invertase Pin-like site-specific DNA recombinase